jgi:hypothetical protein
MCEFLSHSAHLRCDLTPMAAHPDVVPAQHQHSDAEDGSVEDFLTHSGSRFGNLARSGGNRNGAYKASGDAAERHHASVRYTAAGCHDDANDQGRFEYFAKDDESRRKHDVSKYFSSLMQNPSTSR